MPDLTQSGFADAKFDCNILSRKALDPYQQQLMAEAPGERLTTTLNYDPSLISIPIDGNLTAEASITHRWLPDSPKTRAPRGIRRTSANCTSNETSRCLSL